MTGRLARKSAQPCAACWAAHRCSPSASCWCSGDPSLNPRKRKHRYVGASPLRPSDRRLREKQSARRANPARRPPQHPTPGAAAWPSDRLRGCRPAPLARRARQGRRAPDPVRVASVPVGGPLVRPQRQGQAVGPPRQEARRPPAPPRCGFVRRRAASPVGRSTPQHDPSRARHLRRARALTPELRCPQR